MMDRVRHLTLVWTKKNINSSGGDSCLGLAVRESVGVPIEAWTIVGACSQVPREVP